MWEGDHVEFWIDADLMGDYNEAINSNDDFQFGFSPGNFGKLGAEAIMWVPLPDYDLSGKIKMGAKRTDSGYTIEVMVPLDFIFTEEVKGTGRAKVGENALGPRQGLKLGISIEVSDCDDEKMPQETLMSSSVNRVWGDPTTFGILELK